MWTGCAERCCVGCVAYRGEWDVEPLAARIALSPGGRGQLGARAQCAIEAQRSGAFPAGLVNEHDVANAFALRGHTLPHVTVLLKPRTSRWRVGKGPLHELSDPATSFRLRSYVFLFDCVRPMEC
jgi:hypothetical protein